MERELKTLEIQGHNIVVKAYATARESQAINTAVYKGISIEIVNEAPRLKDFDPSSTFLLHNAMVENLVVSVDGKSENVLDTILDLQSDVFDELIRQLDAVVSKKKN